MIRTVLIIVFIMIAISFFDEVKESITSKLQIAESFGKSAFRAIKHEK